MSVKPSVGQQLVPIEVIERRILLIRGHKVMLDSHLAGLYEVPTKRLNEAVKRNLKRFPPDFMSRLTKEEADALTSHFAMPNLRSQIATSSHGGRRYLPYTFTEQGVAMLSTVLNSERAIAVNIAIMRTFVRLRQILADHKELAERLTAIEKRYDRQFKVVFDVLKQLTEPPTEPAKEPIGFMPLPSKKNGRK
jgi:ORF6N domain